MISVKITTELASLEFSDDVVFSKDGYTKHELPKTEDFLRTCIQETIRLNKELFILSRTFTYECNQHCKDVPPGKQSLV